MRIYTPFYSPPRGDFFIRAIARGKRKRILESKTGESGVIPLGSMEVEFALENDAAFFFSKENLDIIENAEQGAQFSIPTYFIDKNYIGVVDRDSVEYTDKLTAKIKILDSLFLLKNIFSKQPRANFKSILQYFHEENNWLPRYKIPQNAQSIRLYRYGGDSNSYGFSKCFNFKYRDDSGTDLSSTSYYNTPDVGDIIKNHLPPYDEMLIYFKGYSSVDQSLVFQVKTNADSYFLGNYYIFPSPHLQFKYKEYNGVDIYEYEYVSNYNITPSHAASGFKIKGINPLKLLKALLKIQFKDSQIITEPPDLSPPLLPVEFYKDLLDDKPLGEEAIEAIKILASACGCYIYCRLGPTAENQDITERIKIIIKEKNIIAEEQIDFDLTNIKVENYKEKRTWDKKVDYVEVEAIAINPSTGIQTSFLGGYPSNLMQKPKNIYSTRIYFNNFEQAANAADGFAFQLYNFYGVRRAEISFTAPYSQDATIEEIDVMKNILFRGNKYKIMEISFDDENQKADITAIKI